MNAKEFVSSLFRQWEQGDSSAFMSALASDVIWTAKGRTPISGTYHGKNEYMEKCYKHLLAVFRGPTSCWIHQVLADGNTVVVEWHGETPLESNQRYSQDYCWLVRVSEDSQTIQEVTGYFDTALVNEILADSSPASQSIVGRKLDL